LNDLYFHTYDYLISLFDVDANIRESYNVS